MILQPPFTKISQHFGDNANPLYSGQGLKGHTGTDFEAAWGVAVRAAVSGPVAWVYNRNNPDLMKYRAVGQMVDGGDGLYYEVSYGHLSEIYVAEGQMLSRGDLVGRVGNTGECYVGQHEVTEAEKEAGSHAGAHLHFQVRKCVSRKTSKAGPSERIITDDKGAYTLSNGNFVFATEYDNGYNGCIDPEQFFGKEKYFFSRDLYLGMTGEDVRELQKYLNIHNFVIATSGPGSPGQESNYYGTLTQNAVRKLQLAYGIQPSAGYFGPLTRAYVNTHD